MKKIILIISLLLSFGVKARKLLIKAKQIERTGQDYSGNTRSGYVLVTNRMYDLLQEKFDDSDATLRHLESQEFKDFVKVFKATMSEIKSVLSSIKNNTKDLSKYAKQMVEISKQGFNDAKANRDMTAYKLEQHEKWQKFMHFRDNFRDKGYN